MLTGFQESRRPIRHRSTHIHEHLRVPGPGIVVPVRPVGPALGISCHQPSLCHHATTGHQAISSSKRPEIEIQLVAVEVIAENEEELKNTFDAEERRILQQDIDICQSILHENQ